MKPLKSEGHLVKILHLDSRLKENLILSELQRRRAVSQQIHQLFIQFINYVWQLLHVSTLLCHLQGAFLVPSERCSIEKQSVEYCLSTAPQLNISQKALGTLPEDGNVMPKHVGATIHN
jgi:hypothetical protein